MRTDGLIESVARGSDEPLFAVSPGGRVVWWSHLAEALFGRSREEAVGRSALSLVVHHASVDLVSHALRVAMESGSAACRARCTGRAGRPLPAPLALRFERRGEGAAADLLVVAGPERDSPVVALTPLERSADGAPPPLREPALAPSPEGVEVGLAHALLSSHDANVLLARVGRALVPTFADACAGSLVEPGGRTRLAALVGEGIEDAAGAEPAAAERRLVLPLVGRTRPLGRLLLHRASRSFEPHERAWAENVARRVAIEIENLRLLERLRRAQEDAHRAAERVQQYERLTGALSEATTPRQVLDALMTQAGVSLGATAGALATLTTDRTDLEVTGVTSGAEALTAGKPTLAVSDRAPLAEAARSGQPVLVEQLRAAIPHYEHLARLPTETLESSLVALPLTLKGRSVGALGFLLPRRPLDVDAWSTLHALTRHGADAMERVRLYDAERRARAEAGEEARRLALLADTSRILADSFEDRDALQRLAEKLVPPVADWCLVFEAKAQRLDLLAAFHRDPGRRSDLRLLAERMLGEGASPLGLGKVLSTGRPVLYFSIPDHLLPGLAANAEQLALLRAVGVTSQMMVPLTSRDRLLGVLVVSYADMRRYAPGDVVFVEALARRMAVALENARLYEKARESEERYRLLVDGVRDYAIFYLDPEGRVATWSPAAQRLLGYTTEEAIGMPHDRFYPPEEIARDRPRLNRERARREGRHEEDGVRVRKDGSPMQANVVITCLRDEHDRERGYVLLMRDLTETVRAREALERARTQLAANEKLSALGTLVSGVAHEIRTPLTAMANNLHLLDARLRALETKHPNVPVAPLLEQVDGSIEGIDRLNRLVEDLRKFARVKAGTVGRVSLDEPVSAALRLFSAAHRGRVEVEAHLQPTPVLEVDVLQVQQVVLNLLQNAAEAMPHGGRIRVRTQPEGSGACLVVEDDGDGMPPEVRHRIFEEFFTTKPTGTGLGLSIVRRIVEAHRGTIACESEPGRGTSFSIRLPGRPL